jgi:hypothetical protein
MRAVNPALGCLPMPDLIGLQGPLPRQRRADRDGLA